MGFEILFLSLEDVIACGGTDMAAAVEDVRRGFHLLSQGKVLQPHKTSVKPPNRGLETRSGLINTLPCYVEDSPEAYFGFKIGPWGT
jgi:ornithine cyclodeaminase/alanine dehydrogenase-like protein (mu-crystallin family)